MAKRSSLSRGEAGAEGVVLSISPFRLHIGSDLALRISDFGRCGMSLTPQQTLALAMQQHQMGRLDEAQSLYRQVLERDPNHADALGLLGTAMFQSGRADEAIELLRRAITLNPNSALHHSNLGMALASQKQYPLAIEALERALSLRPDFPEALNNLGNALNESGSPREAVGPYQRAIALRPDFAQAHDNLGHALLALGRVDEAIRSYGRAIELMPSLAKARLHLGNAHYQKGETQEAMAVYRVLLENWPDYPEAHNAMGHLLKEAGRTDEAIAKFREALRLKSNSPEALHNLGVMLQDIGQVDEAIALQRQAIAARPDFADAHFALSWGLLLKGDFREGWEEHEWRIKRPQWLRTGRHFAQPIWDGSELRGRCLLLHSEEGFGDTIQFIRYMPLVAQRASGVIVLCPQPLRRLLEGQLGIKTLITPHDPLPPFDVHCPLMTLPKLFETTLETIPAEIPYLRAEPRRVEEFSLRIRQGDKETGRQGDARPNEQSTISPSPSLPLSPSPLRVGLAWAGSASFTRDRGRSIHLDQLAPLMQIPNVRWYSVQKGPSAEELSSHAITNRKSQIANITDWTSDLTDFADTAALISALDLVITIDTAVAHLAGALGKPTWVLLPFTPDWRWLLDRADSPWYPTVRLFRQPRLGDWETPVRRMCHELEQLHD